MKPLLVIAIVQHYIETAGHRDDQLLQFSVSVTAALRPARHVVQVIHPLNRKWNMLLAFNKAQIPKDIGDLGQVDQAAVGEGHGESTRSFNPFNDRCGISRHDRLIGHIRHYHRTGTYHGIPPDHHTR